MVYFLILRVIRGCPYAKMIIVKLEQVQVHRIILISGSITSQTINGLKAQL